MIEYLNWDSYFFNLKIGKFEIDTLTSSIFNKLIKFKQNENYSLIYLFAKNIEHEVAEDLRNKHLSPVDEKVIFSKEVAAQMSLPDNIQLYSASLTPSLLKLALLSGHKSRFNKDQRLNPKFESLYKLWIQKSLSGEMADAVFVAKRDNIIEGFVTLQNKEQHGQIGLIAVAPAAQGKGMGSKLMQAAEYWCRQNDLKTCSVVTQMENSGACNLYHKAGYTIKIVELVYHI